MLLKNFGKIAYSFAKQGSLSHSLALQTNNPQRMKFIFIDIQSQAFRKNIFSYQFRVNYHRISLSMKRQLRRNKNDFHKNCTFTFMLAIHSYFQSPTI